MNNTPLSSNSPPSNLDKDFEDVRTQMGEMSPDESERRARIEYLRSLTGKKSKPKKRWPWIVVIVLVLLAVAGFAGYTFLLHENSSDTTNNKKSSQSEPKKESEESSVIGTTKHYDSPAFNLGIDYPENWKVTDNGDGRLLVVAPASAFKTPQGTKQVQVYFMIQAKQSTLPGFKSGNGIATRTSEKIAYSKPTPNQRAQTYTTFVSYAGSATTGVDKVFVTGDLGYQKDQAIPQADIIQGDPLVSIGFAKCSDDKICPVDPTTAHIAIADTSWNDTNAVVKAVKAVLMSLSIN